MIVNFLEIDPDRSPVRRISQVAKLSHNDCLYHLLERFWVEFRNVDVPEEGERTQRHVNIFAVLRQLEQSPVQFDKLLVSAELFADPSFFEES